MNPKSMQDIFSLDPSTRLKVPLTTHDNVDIISQKVHKVLTDDLFMIRIRQVAWDLFRDKKTIDRSDIQAQVAALLEDCGLSEVIANSTVRIYDRSVLNMKISEQDSRHKYARRSVDERVAGIRSARESWEIGVNEELLAVAQELGREFGIVRPTGSVNPHLESIPVEECVIAASDGTAVASAPSSSVPVPSAPVPGSDEIRFLFDSEDVYETIVAIRSPNLKSVYEDRMISQIKIPLATPSNMELTRRFPELNPTFTHFGIDDKNSAWGNRLCYARHEEVELMYSSGACSIIDARKFLRRGAPPGLRPQLWRTALSLVDECSPQEKNTFSTLRLDCDRVDLLTDTLFLHDVHTITDDPRFFVFEDELKQIVLCFSRDEWVRQNSAYAIHRPLLGMLSPAYNESTAAPPCAVQPFAGLATYFAPLCYMYRDIPSLYSVCRSMYAQIWCKLNVISSDDGTLLHICKTFEDLLISNNPKLVFHLSSIGFQPLQVAMPWMQLGFVNLLEMDQILILWDRLIGYSDPIILAVFAAAVFMLRAESLMQMTSIPEINKMLSEGSRLKVVPLLQLFLPFPSAKMVAKSSTTTPNNGIGFVGGPGGVASNSSKAIPDGVASGNFTSTDTTNPSSSQLADAQFGSVVESEMNTDAGSVMSVGKDSSIVAECN